MRIVNAVSLTQADTIEAAVLGPLDTGTNNDLACRVLHCDLSSRVQHAKCPAGARVPDVCLKASWRSGLPRSHHAPVAAAVIPSVAAGPPCGRSRAQLTPAATRHRPQGVRSRNASS